MARPQKTGLSYFPVDVDIYEDDKMQFISARFGMKGEGIVFRLLAKIYRNGYHIRFDEDALLLFAKSCDLRNEKNLVNDVVNELVKREFFSKLIFDSFAVLTSRAIQLQYVKICNDSKRIGCTIEPKYDLTMEETEFPTQKTQVSDTVNTTKKSKVNESKVNKSKELNSQNLEINDLPSFVSENRKKIAPPVGPPPKLTKEFLKQDFLNNRDIEKLYENNNIADDYEKVIDSFIYEAFAVGKNENWKNIQDARSHLINSFKYYNNKHGSNNNFQPSHSTGNFERPNLFGKEGKSSNRLVPIGQRPSISDIRQKTTFEVSE